MQRIRPSQIAPDTFVIHQLDPAPPIGNFYANSMVITGEQPVIVDTGTPINRQNWLEDAFSIVDPNDVRWVFVSHDDNDHTGNLLQVLDACPNATVLINWFGIGRLAGEYLLPLPRVRFMNPGDVLDAGDRRLVAVLPPVFDAPTTRGLFDTTSEVLWAADAFAASVFQHVEDAADLPAAEYRESFLVVQRMLSPWHSLLDHGRYSKLIDGVEALPIRTVAGAHGPTLSGPMVAEAFRMLRELPHMGPWQPYAQADLEQWLAAATGAPVS